MMHERSLGESLASVAFVHHDDRGHTALMPDVPFKGLMNLNKPYYSAFRLPMPALYKLHSFLTSFREYDMYLEHVILSLNKERNQGAK